MIIWNIISLDLTVVKNYCVHTRVFQNVVLFCLSLELVLLPGICYSWIFSWVPSIRHPSSWLWVQTVLQRAYSILYRVTVANPLLFTEIIESCSLSDSVRFPHPAASVQVWASLCHCLFYVICIKFLLLKQSENTDKYSKSAVRS